MTVGGTAWRRTALAWAVASATAVFAQDTTRRAEPDGVSTNRLVFRRQVRRSYTRPVDMVKPEVAIRLPSEQPVRPETQEPGLTEANAMAPGMQTAGVAAYWNQVRAANALRERARSEAEQDDWLLPRSPLMDLGLYAAPSPTPGTPERTSWGWLADGVERLSQHRTAEEEQAASLRAEEEDLGEWLAAYFPSLAGDRTAARGEGDRSAPRAAPEADRVAADPFARVGMFRGEGEPAPDPRTIASGDTAGDPEARASWLRGEDNAPPTETFVGTMDAAQIRAALDAGRLTLPEESSVLTRAELEAGARNAATADHGMPGTTWSAESVPRARTDAAVPGLPADDRWGSAQIRGEQAVWTRGGDMQGRGFWAGESTRDRWSPTRASESGGADRGWSTPASAGDIFRSSSPGFAAPPPARTEEPAPWLRPTRMADAPNYFDPISPRR
jgi:hypothetical protein